MIGYIYYQDAGNTVLTVQADIIKGALSIGMVLGQFLFGLFVIRWAGVTSMARNFWLQLSERCW